MLGVIYEMKSHKKINGTLFYCFEYFVFLNKSKLTLFYVTNITLEYLKYIKELFRDKYNFDESLLDLIIPLNTLREIYQSSEVSKMLFLDAKTYLTVGLLIKTECILYSNEGLKAGIDIPKSKHKKITVFGFYEHQTFDIKEKLKFNFDIFKPISNVKTDTAFLSSLTATEDEILTNVNVTESNHIMKPTRKGVPNLFESFDTLYYYHTALDKNNRLIPECFYYHKTIKITYTNLSKDSIFLRYTDILENGIESYRLTEDDLVIKEMLME